MYLALNEMLMNLEESHRPSDGYGLLGNLASDLNQQTDTAVQFVKNEGHTGGRLFNVTVKDPNLICQFGTLTEVIDMSDWVGRTFLEAVLKNKVLTFYVEGKFLKEFRFDHLHPDVDKTVVWGVAILRTRDEARVVTEYEISDPENTKSLVPGRSLFR
jgi:hypothetical protein